MSEWSPVDVGVSSLGKPQRWPSSSRTFKELVTETLRGKTLQKMLLSFLTSCSSRSQFSNPMFLKGTDQPTE